MVGFLEGRRKRWLVALLLLAVAAGWQLFGDQLKLRAGLPTPAMPHKRAALRVATWNIENFPGPRQDLPALRRAMLDLDADVVAVQEVKDAVALAELFPEYALELSEGGGRGHQRLGLLYDPETITVEQVREYGELGLGGRVRPALGAYVRHRGDGPDFHVLVVHLKAMPDGYDLRREQWALLSKIVQQVSRSGPGAGDQDLVLLGDFNAVGDADATPSETGERRELAALLGRRALAPVEVAGGCSAYWDGERRDRWKEPSLIDLIWIRDLAEIGAERSKNPVGAASRGPTARVGTHCGQHACRAFESTEAYPEPTYETVSDHCPVVLDLPLSDDDP